MQRQRAKQATYSDVYSAKFAAENKSSKSASNNKDAAGAHDEYCKDDDEQETEAVYNSPEKQPMHRHRNDAKAKGAVPARRIRQEPTFHKDRGDKANKEVKQVGNMHKYKSLDDIPDYGEDEVVHASPPKRQQQQQQQQKNNAAPSPSKNVKYDNHAGYDDDDTGGYVPSTNNTGAPRHRQVQSGGGHSNFRPYNGNHPLDADDDFNNDDDDDDAGGCGGNISQYDKYDQPSGGARGYEDDEDDGYGGGGGYYNNYNSPAKVAMKPVSVRNISPQKQYQAQQQQQQQQQQSPVEASSSPPIRWKSVNTNNGNKPLSSHGAQQQSNEQNYHQNQQQQSELGHHVHQQQRHPQPTNVIPNVKKTSMSRDPPPLPSARSDIYGGEDEDSAYGSNYGEGGGRSGSRGNVRSLGGGGGYASNQGGYSNAHAAAGNPGAKPKVTPRREQAAPTSTGYGGAGCGYGGNNDDDSDYDVAPLSGRKQQPPQQKRSPRKPFAPQDYADGYGNAPQQKSQQQQQHGKYLAPDHGVRRKGQDIDFDSEGDDDDGHNGGAGYYNETPAAPSNRRGAGGPTGGYSGANAVASRNSSAPSNGSRNLGNPEQYGQQVPQKATGSRAAAVAGGMGHMGSSDDMHLHGGGSASKRPIPLVKRNQQSKQGEEPDGPSNRFVSPIGVGKPANSKSSVNYQHQQQQPPEQQGPQYRQKGGGGRVLVDNNSGGNASSPEQRRSLGQQSMERNYSNAEEQFAFSKAPRPTEYKPYSLKQYRNIRPKEYVEIANLKPDLNSDALKAKRANQERIKEFSKNLQNLNKNVLSEQRKLPPASEVAHIKISNDVQASNRLRAIEFAKNVPKPKVVQGQGASPDGGRKKGGRRRAEDDYHDDDNGGDYYVTSNDIYGGDYSTQAKMAALETKHVDTKRQVDAIKKSLGLGK